MDGAISNRKYPAYTTAQLERFVSEGSGTPAMVQEIADRKAGKSVIRVVPQLTPSGESRTVREPRFAIGTEYTTRGKHPRECVVVDVLRTYNSANELVEVRYLTAHTFMGQTVTERVCETTIAMGNPQYSAEWGTVR